MALLLDRDRERAGPKIVAEVDSVALAEVREAAAKAGIWLHIGSMPLLDEDSDKWVNRAFLIAPNGDIAARYDKIHLFDVELDDGGSWHESGSFARGDKPCVVDCDLGRIGFAICYDLRFPALFDRLGSTRPDLILCPAAFTYPTGVAHWHVLLRARAIETTSYILAAAQTGRHEDGRQTYGHSLAIGPWGEILHDMGEAPGLAFVSLDLAEPERIRLQLPGLANRQDIDPVEVTPA